MWRGWPARLSAAGIGEPERVRVHFVEHHRAHLASAFFASPFDEAAVVSIDGFGDFSSVMWGVGRGNHIDVRGCVQFPHSLGQFYTAFTQLLGFPKYGDEYKMMGLSAYGQPRFAPQVRDVVRVEGDQVRLNLDYFIHHTTGVEMTWDGGEPSIGADLFRRRWSTSLRPAARAARPARTSSRGSRRFGSAGARGVLLRAAEHSSAKHRAQESLPGRRRGAELRRQRHDLRAHAVSRTSMSSPPRTMPARRLAPRCTSGTRS